MKYCLDCNEPKSNKGKYCKKCGYKHRTRPSGLKYKIVATNKGWFKKGVWSHEKGWTHSRETIERLRQMRKGIRVSIKSEFKKGQNTSIKNVNWKGDNVGYDALHRWVYRNYGKPKRCEFCGSTKQVEWASKNYKYTRNFDDWITLCFKCHRKYDRKNGWGIATRKFSL